MADRSSQRPTDRRHFSQAFLHTHLHIKPREPAHPSRLYQSRREYRLVCQRAGKGGEQTITYCRLECDLVFYQDALLRRKAGRSSKQISLARWIPVGP